MQHLLFVLRIKHFSWQGIQFDNAHQMNCSLSRSSECSNHVYRRNKSSFCYHRSIEWYEYAQRTVHIWMETCSHGFTLAQEQYRYRRMPGHFLSHTTQEPSLEAGTPMTGHDNQINTL